MDIISYGNDKEAVSTHSIYEEEFYLLKSMASIYDKKFDFWKKLDNFYEDVKFSKVELDLLNQKIEETIKELNEISDNLNKVKELVDEAKREGYNVGLFAD